MNRVFKTVLLGLSCALSCIATAPIEANCSGLELGVGYRRDSVSWSFKNPDCGHISTKNHLRYDDIEQAYISAKYRGMFADCVYVRAFGDYSWILDATLKNNVSIKTQHYTHSKHSRTKEGHYLTGYSRHSSNRDSFAWDVNAGVGRPLDWSIESLRFVPMIGFSYHVQQIKMSGKNHVHYDISSEDLHASEVDHRGSNRFKARTWTPWIGFDLYYSCGECWNFFAEFEYHIGAAMRKRTADTEIGYFNHHSKARSIHGPTIRIGANTMICDNWYVEAMGAYSAWESYTHHDTFRWESGSLELALGYMF